MVQNRDPSTSAGLTVPHQKTEIYIAPGPSKFNVSGTGLASIILNLQINDTYIIAYDS